MDQNQAFLSSFSNPNRKDDLLLDSDMAGWQPFSTPSEFQMQKQFLNSPLPQHTPTKNYDNELFGYSDEQNQVTRRFTPSADYQRRAPPENIINTDFLSAIPNARQSKTVKRKLNYEDNGIRKAENTLQKQKTYFPFEFIGHASRESVPNESSSAILNKENERRFHNLTMVTGYALRKPDVNGSVFESSFTTQNEPPLPARKRARKYSSKNKTNPVVALEQHFEQIRRKHVEFNWDVPDSQNTMKDNGASWTDVDIQCVPTTPFFEQYSSPSLYSSNEPPLPTPMAWMPAPRPLVQDFEQGTVQRLQTNSYNGREIWPGYSVPALEFQETPTSAMNEDHLYPY